MLQVKQIIFYLLSFNCLFLLFNLPSNENPLRPNTNAHTYKESQEEIGSKEEVFTKAKVRKIKADLKKTKKEIEQLQPLVDKSSQRHAAQTDRRTKVNNVLRLSNPLFLLGAYPKITDEYLNMVPDEKPEYEQVNYGLFNDYDYCELADLYNLAHPDNMFESKNFFTDYPTTDLVRDGVIRKTGVDTMKQVSRDMKKEKSKTAQYHLNPIITNYFTISDNFHIYHQMGKHFNCATQMYNHIPGHGVLRRNDYLSDNINSYAAKFKGGRKHCFNKKTTFFPYSYRLYVEEECKAFFKHINSEEYINSLQKVPIQFLMKNSRNHLSDEVFGLDHWDTEAYRNEYGNGKGCGMNNNSVVAQTYIANPLLLDFDNNFKLRVYLLIASTNPLIAYYHDGFPMVLISSSSPKLRRAPTIHFFDAEAQSAQSKTTMAMMTDSEIRDYQDSWTLNLLGEYLYENGKVDDSDWIENTLKPKFSQALIHTARMSAHTFWNQSNVYEIYSVDFVLDDKLNLWLEEVNPSPEFIGISDYKTMLLTQMLEDLFEIQYGLYRSRMKRVLDVINKINQDRVKNGNINYAVWRKEYDEAVKNRFEPEYEISPDNSFELIMDMNREGKEAFFGYLEDECVY